MSWKVILVGGLLVVFWLAYKSDFFGRMDRWNNSMRSGSEERASEQFGNSPAEP